MYKNYKIETLVNKLKNNNLINNQNALIINKLNCYWIFYKFFKFNLSTKIFSITLKI